MDWGIFRGTEQGKRLLRDQLTFPKHYYYICIVLNVLFRCYWIIPFLQNKDCTDTSMINNLQAVTFGSMMIEAIRRTFWAIFRVENESFNNFEKYRTIVAIPPLRELRDKKK